MSRKLSDSVASQFSITGDSRAAAVNTLREVVVTSKDTFLINNNGVGDTLVWVNGLQLDSADFTAPTRQSIKLNNTVNGTAQYPVSVIIQASNTATILDSGNAGQLISSQTLTANTNSVSFTGLNSLVDGEYNLEINLISVGANVLSFYVNGDTTDSNYLCQRMYSSGASVTGVLLTNPQVIDYNTGGIATASVRIRVINGYCLISSTSAVITGTLVAYVFVYSAYKKTALVNGAITQLSLSIAGGAAHIGAGSTFRLYGTNIQDKLVAYNPMNWALYSSDRLLKPGETAYVDYNNVSSLPLNIKTEEGLYEMIIISNCAGTPSNDSATTLRPNNTVYSNILCEYTFSQTALAFNAANGASTMSSWHISSGEFKLMESLTMQLKLSISTFTTAKSVNVTGNSKTAAGLIKNWLFFNTWGDFTTPWTSLGTLVFPFAQTGKVVIRRII